MERKYLKLLLPTPYETGADYLILEDDAGGSTGGAFVYYMSSSNRDGEFGGDEWHESFENAQNIVAVEYGLSINDWQVMDSEEVSRFVSWYHG